MTSTIGRAPTAPHNGFGRFFRDTATLTGRTLMHWRQRPVSILLTFLFPVLMVLMFGYLFGGAMNLPGGGYMEFLVPGMLTMTMLFGLESMVLSVTNDTAKGITERIRSMPINPAPVLMGRTLADMANGIVGLGVMVVTGLLVGWTAHRGIGATLAAMGLLLWLRFAFAWVGIYLGLLLKTPESAVGVQVIVWPVGFLSSAFVSPGTMPGWLDAIATWNPISATATAARELFGNPDWAAGGWATQHSVALAVIWPAALTLIFLPLAARQYRALSR